MWDSSNRKQMETAMKIKYRTECIAVCASLIFSALAGAQPVLMGQGAPSADNYPISESPLQPNGAMLKTKHGCLVRIRDVDVKVDPRHFDVFFGPTPADAGKEDAGQGRYHNSDPEWENVQGYAIMRGIRPSGSTRYVKATSNSSTLITLVDLATNEERVLLTEGTVAWVYWKNEEKPDPPNLTVGNVIIIKMVDGTRTIQPQVLIEKDHVSKELLDYLKKTRGARETLNPIIPQ